MTVPWRGLAAPTNASWIAFLVSFCFHTTLLLLCALVWIGGGRGGLPGGGQGTGLEGTFESGGLGAGELDMTSSDSLSSFSLNADEFVDVPQVPEQNFSSIDVNTEIEFGATTPDAPSLGALTHAVSGMSSSGEPSIAATVEGAVGGSLGGAQGGTGGGTAGYGSGDGSGKATFFGVQATGGRFVFVVDSSSSMMGARWEALCYELERAISGLDARQHFFVISFDTEPRPMFGEFPPKGEFLRPNRSSILKLRRWIRSLNLGESTLPAKAMEIAVNLKPDAIFLLSDGEILDRTVLELRRFNGATDNGPSEHSIPVHTILLESRAGRRTLETISRENGGTFSEVRL